MSGEDLLEFYDSIDFEIVDSFETPSPSGTIKLKHVFPITEEARNKTDKDDEVEILEIAGEGGQKIVYKGQLQSDSRFLGLALMNEVSDLDEVENFLREARISMSLRHPSIVPVHDFGIDEMYGPYIVMDWVEGETLNHILRKLRLGVDVYEEVFTLKKLLEYYLDIAKAVSFAHSKDIIHSDIKPENILIDYDKDKAFLFDWGVAKAFSPLENFNIDPVLLNNDTKAGYFRGTPGYMPPEQITEQKKNEKTDIYQLGALLYTLVFRHCPVEGDNVEEILEKTLAGEIFVDSLSKEILPLIKICKKAMSPDPDDRYNDVRSIINEVKEIKIKEAKKKNYFLRHTCAALLPFILLISAFLFVDNETPVAMSEFVEVEQVLPQQEILVNSNNLLTAQDIALMEEFSHFEAENYSEPLSLSNLPSWYSYLDFIIKREMGPMMGEDVVMLFRIENLISLNVTEDGL